MTGLSSFVRRGILVPSCFYIYLICQACYFRIFLHRERISSGKIATHMNSLSNIRWGEFAGKAYNPTISCIKDETAIVCKLLQRHHHHLCAKARSSFFPKSLNENRVPAAFKKLQGTVKLSDAEFHTSVDSAFRRKMKAPGRPSPFSVCINISVKAAVNNLRTLECYEPYFLTDEAMGIDRFAESADEPFLSTQSRATYRERFRKAMALGIDKMCIHFYGKMYGARGGEGES